MKPLDLEHVVQFVNTHITGFHSKKIKSLQELKLKDILKKKNPYLFKAKNIGRAQDLITDILDAFLSSSEEKIFGDFLEDLAIFIAGKTADGRKSSATGIDLEFVENTTHYIISIKSGPNWGNNSQHRRQEEDFKNAQKVLKQSHFEKDVQPVLGICYGKVRTSFVRGYLKVVGQNFWYFISKNPSLYTDIIEPLGYNAKRHNDDFLKQKDAVINLFTAQFMNDFCVNGQIEWVRLVEYTCGNLDLTK